MTRATFFTYVVLLVLCGPAAADEAITGFGSDVSVNADGSLDVVEDITVEVVEGGTIKRGIRRNLPSGGRLCTAVTAVERDGMPEQFAVFDSADGVMVRIGNADVMLVPGTHRYRIATHVQGAIDFGPQADRLDWPVTGWDWQLGIDKAEAVVRLPPGAHVNEFRAMAGSLQDMRSEDATAVAEANVLHASSTSRLTPGLGLSLSVAFASGAVKNTGPCKAQ